MTPSESKWRGWVPALCWCPQGSQKNEGYKLIKTHVWGTWRPWQNELLLESRQSWALGSECHSVLGSHGSLCIHSCPDSLNFDSANLCRQKKRKRKDQLIFLPSSAPPSVQHTPWGRKRKVCSALGCFVHDAPVPVLMDRGSVGKEQEGRIRAVLAFRSH